MSQEVEFSFKRTKEKVETSNEKYEFIDIETGNLITSSIVNIAKAFELFINNKGNFVKRSFMENSEFKTGIDKTGKPTYKQYYEIIDNPIVYLIVIKRKDYKKNKNEMTKQLDKKYDEVKSMDDVRNWNNRVFIINRKPGEKIKLYRKYKFSYKGVQYKIGIDTLKYSVGQRDKTIKDFKNYLEIPKPISDFQSDVMRYILMSSRTLGEPITNISLERLPSVDGIKFTTAEIPNIKT